MAADEERWRWHREPGTDDEWERIWTCCGGPFDEGLNGHYVDCATRAARPAVADAVMGAAITEGVTEARLREALTDWFFGHFSTTTVPGLQDEDLEQATRDADAVLALPEMRALLDAAEDGRKLRRRMEAHADRLEKQGRGWRAALARDDRPGLIARHIRALLDRRAEVADGGDRG